MRPMLPLIAVVALTACSANPDASSGSVLNFNAGPPAIRVNDLPVPASILDYIAQGRNLDLTKKQQRVDAIRELSDYVLLAQAARREGAESLPEFASIVEASRLQGVANAMLAHYTRTHPVTEAMIKADYDDQVDKAGPNTYDFSLLMFDNEADAIKAADALVGGAEFSTVFDEWHAKAKQAKAFKGVRPSQLPAPELVQALRSLKAGESTMAPVRSQYGWHLLHADAAQAYTPPAFDLVKDDLKKLIEKRQREAYTERLRSEALILDLQTPVEGAPVEGAPAAEPAAPLKQG